MDPADGANRTLPVVEARLTPREHDLGGGLIVRRLLPTLARRTVGGFVFLDHFGPVTFAPGTGMDVRPHPHIGLATVTYLFEGRVLHRDSLGSSSAIEPGAINWMTAGRGIVHSERTPAEDRSVARRVHGLQMWVGLPRAEEECAPSFVHHPADSLPTLEAGGVTVRVLVGAGFGARSPVQTLSPLALFDLRAPAGATLRLPDDIPERALYVLEGELRSDAESDAEVILPGTLAVLSPGRSIELRAQMPTHAVLLGGAPLDGPRHLDWNFVGSSLERIARARDDWAHQRFGQVPGETEFIPLPTIDRRPSRP